MTPTAIRRRAAESEIERCRQCYQYWRFESGYASSVDDSGARLAMPDMPYLRVLAALLADETRKYVFVDKARQMMATWEMSAYMVWRAQFRPRIELMVMPKKEDESDYIVRDRMFHIWEFQPKFIREFVPCKASFNLLEFGNGTRIKGLPEGENQFRGHQGDSVFFDECAAMNYFGDRFRKGAAPMARHRCRVYAASTASGHGDWWELVKDIQRDRVLN